MKKISLIILGASLFIGAKAQWNPNGDNVTTGRVKGKNLLVYKGTAGYDQLNDIQQIGIYKVVNPGPTTESLLHFSGITGTIPQFQFKVSDQGNLSFRAAKNSEGNFYGADQGQVSGGFRPVIMPNDDGKIGMGIIKPLTKVNIVDYSEDPILRITGQFSNGSPSMQYLEGKNTAEHGFETKYNGVNNRFEFNCINTATNKSTAMSITRSNGNIGIGTLIPISKLHIVTNPLTRTSNFGSSPLADLIVEDEKEALINIAGAQFSAIHFSDKDNKRQGAIEYQHDNGTAFDGEMLFRAGGEEAIKIKYSQTNPMLVEIGTNFNSSDFQVHGKSYLDGEVGVRGDLTIGSYSDTYMNVNENGVGIGVSDPQIALNIVKANNPVLRINGTEGNDMASLQLMEGTNMAKYGFELRYDGVNGNKFQINRYNASETPVSDLTILRTNGNVGIGTTDPQNKLSVNGTLWAKKIKTSLTDAADWVFEEDYNLRSLEEVENYVKEKKHLPEIPSAQEFADQGVDLAELNNKLLMKVEELTLYTIAQEKQIEQLKASDKKMEQLEKELKELKNLLLTK